jgi:hypothetical protein
MAHNIRVVPDGSSWVVQRSNENVPIEVHERKEHAISFARSLATKERVLVVILDNEGHERIEDPARRLADVPEVQPTSVASSAFNRDRAAQRARAFSGEELESVIRGVCAAFSAETFPGVATLDEVRQMVEILSHEQHKRDLLELPEQTGT